MCLQFGAHPIFQRLRNLSDNQVFNRGRDLAGDLRERWETSDSAVVQRLQVHLPCPSSSGIKVQGDWQALHQVCLIFF